MKYSRIVQQIRERNTLINECLTATERQYKEQNLPFNIMQPVLLNCFKAKTNKQLQTHKRATERLAIIHDNFYRK